MTFGTTKQKLTKNIECKIKEMNENTEVGIELQRCTGRCTRRRYFL